MLPNEVVSKLGLLTLVILLLLALIVAASGRSSVEGTLEQLQQENQQLIKELEAKRASKKKIAQQESPTKTPRNTAVFISQPTKEEIANYILNKFGASGQQMLAIAYCESGLNSNAVGKAGERGIFQVHPVHRYSMEKVGFTWDSMFNWKSNVDYAAILFKYQGYKPWTCARLI